MIEIIALVILSRQIGRMARQKGLSAGRWILRLVVFWVAFELLGMMLASNLFHIPLNENMMQLPPEEIAKISLTGILFAVGGYMLTRYMLEQTPEAGDDDLNQIGR